MRVFTNVSTACSGRHHDRLVLVERRVEQDRHAGLPLELLDQPVVARVHVPFDGLQPPRVVDVVHGGHLVALVRPRPVDENHERRAVVLLVPLAGSLGEDRRRERAKRLAVLDARVEDVLHVVASRVGDDRAVAERARAELHPSLEPAHDLARGDVLGDRAEQRVVVEQLRLEARAADRAAVVRVRVLGARVRVIHHEAARAAERLVPHVVRGADRDAAVAGRGLDVEPVEGGLGADAAVRDGVERDAAGEAEVRQAGAAMRLVDCVQVRLLEHGLQRAGDVLVVLRQLALRLARGAERLLELGREDAPDRRRAVAPRHVHALRRGA